MTPSILFLVVDCLRADRAFAQAELAPDGLLGRVVRSGFSFRNAVTVTPTTTPAVATMLTGCYPFEHGLRGLAGYTFPRDLPTLAESLRALGYRTEADVTGPLQPELKLFDTFDGYRYVDGHGASVHGRRGADLERRIEELLAGGVPWFLLFHVWDLHEPRQVPSAFSGAAPSRRIYDRALAALDQRLARLGSAAGEDVVVCVVGDHGENVRFEPRGRLGNGLAGLMWRRGTRRPMQTVARALIARGARSSSKRLLRTAPRALITHGHHLFEPLLRVPLVFAGAGIPPGSSDALVSHTDLAPTFAALASGWFGGGVGAQQLRFERDGDPERRVFLETAWVTSLPGVRQVGVRTPRWKYLELAGGGSPALFDLRADPGERRNVVGRYPDVSGALREELRAAFASGRVGDEMGADTTTVVERRLADLGYFN